MENLQLKPGYVILKLPNDADSKISMLKSGIWLKKPKDSEAYTPTHGTVMQISSAKHDVEIGDEVFFGNHVWNAAKRCAFGDPELKGYPAPSRYFAIVEKVTEFVDGWGDSEKTEYYLLIPEKAFYLKVRNGELYAMPNMVVAEPIAAELPKTSLIIIPDNAIPEYEDSKYKVFLAPEGADVKPGDIAITLKHCDIEIENPIANPLLSKTFFVIELEDIIAKIEQ